MIGESDNSCGIKRCLADHTSPALPQDEVTADFTVIFWIRVFSLTKLHLLSRNIFSKHSVTYLYWKSTHNH